MKEAQADGPISRRRRRCSEIVPPVLPRYFLCWTVRLTCVLALTFAAHLHPHCSELLNCPRPARMRMGAICLQFWLSKPELFV